jgi:hypothetical protein
MVIFEAVNAKFGDALLLRFDGAGKRRLWLVDGGPAGVWRGFLRPRLQQLQGSGETLTVDLAMLSHIDDDHVNGVLQMVKGLADGGTHLMDGLDIRRFWHNSFGDLVGSSADPAGAVAALTGFENAAAAALAGTASGAVQAGAHVLSSHRELAVLASVRQGLELREALIRLALAGNEPFMQRISSSLAPRRIDGAKVTPVGPVQSRLDALELKWREAQGNPAALASLFREDLDESVTNLSSIVILVEIRRLKILLTGDARGDDILAGFRESGNGRRLPISLDLLKVPHHGSDRNLTREFLEAFPARNYVISADGKHGNPDADTLRAIVETRAGDADYTIHLTNRVNGLPDLLDSLSRGRRFRYRFRDEAAFSIAVELE